MVRTDINHFSVDKVIEMTDSKITLEKSEKGAMAHINGLRPDTVSLDNFKKFYKIVKQVKNITFI